MYVCTYVWQQCHTGTTKNNRNNLIEWRQKGKNEKSASDITNSGEKF